MSTDASWSRGAERRIELFTLGLGAAAALATFARASGRAALGVALGSFVAWLNFRWLKAGVGRLESLSIQEAGRENPHLPRRGGVGFVARYALLAAVLCASFFSSLVPVAAVMAGLFTLVAAVLGEGLYHLFRELARGWGAKPEKDRAA